MTPPPYAAPTVVTDQLAATGLPSALLVALLVLGAAVILVGAGLNIIARPR